MAVLSPGAVPSALLRKDGESLLEFTKAMGILKAFSLIDADDRETNYRMHDLVHLATQEWLESQAKRATYEKGALQVLADKFPSGESQQWDQCKKIYPHAGVVEHFDTSSASTSLQKARLKQKMANYVRAQDQYDPAMKRHEEAAEAFQKERRTRDLETLNNMSDMGLTLTYQGCATKGERLLRTATSGIEEIQGPQDLNTMNHLARLAENLLCQAKFSTAERIYRRVYTNRKAILGEGHLDTLLSLSYLGPPLEWLGRLEESEDVNQRAVGGMQRILPVHHASLYLAEIKLCFILQKRGKLEEAESSARRSLENRLAIYGPGHKWVGWSTQTLSLTLRDQGRHEEALYHSKAVVQMREREFPANHILVIKAIYTLAFLYHGLQGYDQASIHYLDCLARAQMSYGLLHPLPVAIRAQYLRMIERMTDVELNWRTFVSPRAFWMTLSPKQFSILAHFVGVPDPQRHNRNVGVELLETYCFVLVTYARQLWHRVMHMVIIGLIILSVILCESMIFSWIDRRIPFS
ncbi:Tetratricopeptide-like helical domain [Lasallia pustulata]|uniref:Tetratricopeptide-like helical domain n=1 Tax=Lasallia pustulata TaxID=136370 RepID=A0A1W5CVI3_9LECA|nr:Tetratricopeptide-like helical domain [Lasallia pustulata]